MSKQDLTTIALMVAVITVFSQLSLPLPNGVPLTLQVFAVALAGMVLRPKKALICITVYILAGSLGIPVFANFTAGIGKLIGPTGGYIYGFYFLTFYSILDNKSKLTKGTLITLSVLLFHTIGIIHYSIVMQADIIKSIFIISVPYFFKDLISVAAACISGEKIKKNIY